MSKKNAKKKLDHLREEVTDKVKQGRSGSMDRDELRERVSGRMSEVGRAAERRLEQAERSAEAWARRADDELSEHAPKGLERRVRRYPLFTVMASMIIGLVAGLLVGSLLGGHADD